MNPSFYTTVDDLINEINQINREIYPTNLHITEFYKIKNGFNYKCGTIYFDVVYSYKANQFRLNKRNPFKEKEYYITLNEAEDLRESLLAIVLNLIEQSTIKEAKRNLIYSKATEYEEILTILDKLTEDSAIQEYWNLLITPWLMNSDKSIQERVNIEVTKFEIVTGASEFLKKKFIQKELLTMTKTFQLIFSQIATNNKNIYHVIYDNLHKADATVLVFVDTDKSTLDFYCEAFKHFYDEPNIYFIGIEKDPSNITPELIDVAIEALNKSDLPLNDYKLKTFYMPKKDEKALSELKNAIDSLNCSDEDKLQLMKVMTGQL